MNTQDPIEKIIKARMEGVHKTTDVPSWDTVAQSLKRKKRNKYVFWLWSSAGVLGLLALLLFNNFGSQPEAESNPPAVSQEIIIPADTLEQQSSPSSEENTELREDIKNNENPTGVATRKEEILAKDKQPTGDSPDFTEGATPTPTYYYYDSKTGKQISTKDKKVIDSILKSKESEGNNN
ncbi:hypothetical protein [Gilvibacter sp.]|uniref:hypothetical protein n=1 Tax=Gilvibacter sp. TaxID=2729997 RepID=UPI0035BE9AE0